MPGPAPKNDRVRRNKPDLEWVDLPSEGRSEWPDPPGYLSEHGREWWERNWATPAATRWGGEEFDLAVRRAELQGVWRETKDAKVLPEMRHLEAALGLTAKARKELRWRIVEAGEVVEENGKPLSAAERRKRLKVVSEAG